MNPLQDVIGGWKTRPLGSFAAALLAFGLSLLIGQASLMLGNAGAEAERLLAAWPADRCTLLMPEANRAELSRDLTRRLPPGSWLAVEFHNRGAWVLGTLPSDFFEGQGATLPPELIASGEPVALLQHAAAEDLQPGDLLRWEDQAFRVYGVGNFALPAERMMPRRARDLLPPEPEQFLIQLPAASVEPLIRDLLQGTSLRLVDHREKQRQAQAGFRKLRRELSAVAVAAALVAALLLQALYQAEIRERKAEFALRRSLGARPQDIRNQILLEALLGGALPSLIGFAFYLPWLSFATLAGAVGLVVCWMLLCATLPALQAARLHPGDALKGE